MSTEIERVQPIPGAQVVDFDYEAAEDALAIATRRLPTVTGDVLSERVTAAEAVTDEWRGHFREEFDTAETNLRSRFSTMVSYGGPWIGADIRAAATKANERQREYNQARQDELDAEEAAEQEPATTG
ncbi:MAG TPA: hypothetical protein VIR58_14705 [Acidimicrobiales bacterium]